MAATILLKSMAAILDARGHGVQNGQIEVKGPDFNYNILSSHHCAPKFGETPAFFVRLVKHKILAKSTQIYLNLLDADSWRFANFWSTVRYPTYVIVEIELFQINLKILHSVTPGTPKYCSKHESKIAAAILVARGHRVQNFKVELKALDFG